MRPLESGDLDWFTDWNNDPKYNGQYEPLEKNSREKIEIWFNTEKENSWWVILDKRDNPLGQLVTGVNGDYYWLGYILHPNYRGKGYTTDTIKVIVNHLFETYEIVRIQAECNPENKASVRVLEKNRFTYEGLKRKAIYIQGKHMDSAIYSILREEWTPTV